MSLREVARRPPKVLAMGGGGFTMHERSTALDRYVLTLTERPIPKICFIPTASGDPQEQALRFLQRFGGWPCEPSVLSLFHLGRDRTDPVRHLLAQDAVYVGGGSMRNMLAIWREHGVDQAMRAAWLSGTVLAGLSAGAMCWFQGGISKSGGAPEPVAGLGILPGSLSVHLDGEPDRLPAFRRAVAAGALGPGYAADDGAGLVFSGSRLACCVGSRAGARVQRVTPDGAGGTRAETLAVRLLPGAAAGPAEATVDEHGDEGAIEELRALRAGPNRFR